MHFCIFKYSTNINICSVVRSLLYVSWRRCKSFEADLAEYRTRFRKVRQCFFSRSSAGSFLHIHVSVAWLHTQMQVCILRVHAFTRFVYYSRSLLLSRGFPEGCRSERRRKFVLRGGFEDAKGLICVASGSLPDFETG